MPIVDPSDSPNKPPPPSNNPPPPMPADSFEGGEAAKPGSWSSFQEYFGDKYYDEFQRQICMTIAQNIQKDRIREKKVSMRLRRANTGEDQYG